ncbi:S41 family peptidase [Pseudomonadota bacterium]|jgi:carboxyl-terminal processing protease
MTKTAHIPALAAAALLLITTGQAQEATGPAAGAATETPRGTAQLTLDDLRTFTDVFSQVRRNYVEEVDDHTLLDSAIRGMLLELDPHSAYIPAPDYQDFEDNSKGRYSGVGIDVEIRGDQIVVRAVINGSPADEAGINPGDEISAIDGEPVASRSPQDAIDELLGEPGTELVLEILPPGGEPRSITLEREYLQIPLLSFDLLEQSWGYFRISAFHTGSARDLEQSLESIAADHIELRGLVIDLRNNPGGVLQGAVEMADGFLDEGLIVTTRGRNAAMQMEFRAQPGQWLPDTPLLILVDRGSASASEVLAGALQDHRRALIVGERTFGKGSVQSVLPLRNGGGIKLTTARYYTPSGRSIQAEGIEPDIVYEGGGRAESGDHRSREADLARHLDRDVSAGEVATVGSAETRGDFPLEEVLRILEAADILDAPDSNANEAEENS